MGRKKKAPAIPRRLRLRWPARRQSAVAWLETQQGRTASQIGRSCRRHYGTDWPTAIRELSQLGIRFDADWIASLTSSLQGNSRARAAQKAEKQRLRQPAGDGDSDANFAYIAGYTSNGFAFGVTWEEWRRMESDETPDPEAPF